MRWSARYRTRRARSDALLEPSKKKVWSAVLLTEVQRIDGRFPMMSLSSWSFAPRTRSFVDRENVRVASQFVGANLGGGWRNTEIHLDSSLPKSTAGRLDTIDRGTGSVRQLLINPDFEDHRGNPSSVARTLTHEFLHRDDQLGAQGRNNDQHIYLDNRAKALIKGWGLDGLGCPSGGERTWLGFGPPVFGPCQ